MKKLFRLLIDKITLLLCFVKQNRREKLTAGQNRVNLGCGLKVWENWINVDGSFNAVLASMPKFFIRLFYRFSGAGAYYSLNDFEGILTNHKFVHHNLLKNVPFENDSVDFVYTSHFLEHLPKPYGHNFLSEIFRVLRPSGKVRIVVPDLEYAVSLYAKGEKEKMLDDFFFVDEHLGYFARHKYMYDFELLQEYLGAIGFTDIKKCEFGKGDVPDSDKLDVYPEISLYVEATKK